MKDGPVPNSWCVNVLYVSVRERRKERGRNPQRPVHMLGLLFYFFTCTTTVAPFIGSWHSSQNNSCISILTDFGFLYLEMFCGAVWYNWEKTEWSCSLDVIIDIIYGLKSHYLRILLHFTCGEMSFTKMSAYIQQLLPTCEASSLPPRNQQTKT